jgi:L-lactate utilization protein LutB
VNDVSAVELATKRLQAALDALEGAVERRLERDQGQAALATQVHAFDSDRARLAEELDAAVARARRLEAANRDVAEQLDAAIATIRTVVDRAES